MDTGKKYISLFKNKDLLKRAFIHRSYLNETKEKVSSNERLEFLGDAVLELIISEYIFEKFTNFHEGKLTLIRSSIVRTETLALASKKLNFGSMLYLSHGEEENNGRENISILANTYEAFLGAIYLDQGWETAKKFVYETLVPAIPEIIKTKAYLDAKSHLQEVVQEKVKVTPTYRVLKQEGPDHNKTFTVGVFVSDKMIEKGTGKSKQEAESNAAAKALHHFQLKNKT